MKKIFLSVIIVLCVGNIRAMEEESFGEELEHKETPVTSQGQQAPGTPQRVTRELNLQAAPQTQQTSGTPQRATRELHLQGASQAQQTSGTPQRATRELKIQR